MKIKKLRKHWNILKYLTIVQRNHFIFFAQAENLSVNRIQVLEAKLKTLNLQKISITNREMVIIFGRTFGRLFVGPMLLIFGNFDFLSADLGELNYLKEMVIGLLVQKEFFFVRQFFRFKTVYLSKFFKISLYFSIFAFYKWFIFFSMLLFLVNKRVLFVLNRVKNGNIKSVM